MESTRSPLSRTHFTSIISFLLPFLFLYLQCLSLIKDLSDLILPLTLMTLLDDYPSDGLLIHSDLIPLHSTEGLSPLVGVLTIHLHSTYIIPVSFSI